MSNWIEILILAYFLLMNGSNALLIALGALELARARGRRWPELDPILRSHDATPPIAIIAPAFDEEPTIVESVLAFLALDYPNISVIVVNDGSRDRTLARLADRFDLERVTTAQRGDFATRPVRGVYRSRRDPRLLVVDKVNGGKADALNAGINVARTPLVCCVDADSIIDGQALLRLVEPFIYAPHDTVAVGGTIRLANGARFKGGRVTTIDVPRSWLARFQVVEYLRAFLFTRLGLNRLGGNLIVSGALGVFRRDVLVELGGYRSDTVGEDMELIVRVHRHMRERGCPYQVRYVPDPVCYTEAPEDVATLGRQRHRWQRGLLDSLLRHRRMLLNPRYGQVGLISFPLFVLFELLAPLFELFGYLYFLVAFLVGSLDPLSGLLFFAVAWLWGVVVSLQALALDDLGFNAYRGVRARLSLIAAAALENLGYRQLLLVYRLRGMVDFIRGGQGWGEMRRKGFTPEPEPDPAPSAVPAPPTGRGAR